MTLSLNRCFDSYNGPNLVLKYDKEEKRLVNIAVDNRSSPFYALRDRQGNAIGVTACDIDGDGREEIYVLNTNNAFSGTVLASSVCVCMLAWLSSHAEMCSGAPWLPPFLPWDKGAECKWKGLSHLSPYRTTGAINQSEGEALAKSEAARLRLFEPSLKKKKHY